MINDKWLMRSIGVIVLLLFGTVLGYTQVVKSTLKYAGLYEMEGDIEKGRVGSVIVYPETDSTILFYMDLNRGAPSYNSGELYGRLQVKGETGLFYWKSAYTEKGCKLAFTFSDKTLKVDYLEDQDSCGFGFSVWADGDYMRKSDKQIDYFGDPEGAKFYFSKTSPEEYNKE